MKKAFLISVLLITLSCSQSSSDEIISDSIPQNLIGKWKLIGYYDDIGDDPITGTNYHLVENGDEYKFSSDGTFDNIGDIINPDGTFTVSLDSVLTRNYNANSLNPNMVYSDKIFILTDEILQFGCNQNGTLCNTYRYEKVTSVNP